MSVYDGWGKVDTQSIDYEHTEWERSRKDTRIKELEAQVEALTRELKATREELASVREFATR